MKFNENPSSDNRYDEIIVAFRNFANAATKVIFRYVMKPEKHFGIGCVLHELHTAKGRVDYGIYYKMLNHQFETVLYKNLMLLMVQEITKCI
jgi:hypothetical protein